MKRCIICQLIYQYLSEWIFYLLMYYIFCLKEIKHLSVQFTPLTSGLLQNFIFYNIRYTVIFRICQHFSFCFTFQASKRTSRIPGFSRNFLFPSKNWIFDDVKTSPTGHESGIFLTFCICIQKNFLISGKTPEKFWKFSGFFWKIN